MNQSIKDRASHDNDLKRLSVTNAVNSAASISMLMLLNRRCSISRRLEADCSAFSLCSVTFSADMTSDTNRSCLKLLNFSTIKKEGR